MTNLPTFVTHNKDTSDFSVPETFNLDLIGSYTVGIRSEISIPNDHTDGSFIKLMSEYEFTIFVKPCLISDYSAAKADGDIIYTIGGAETLSVTPIRFT